MMKRNSNSFGDRALRRRHRHLRRLMLAGAAVLVLFLAFAASGSFGARDVRAANPADDLAYLQAQVAAGRLDQSLLESLIATGHAQGLTVVSNAAAPASAGSSYAAVKQQILAPAGAGASVVKDYSKLPTQLVSFNSPAALVAVLSANSGIAGVREDHVNTITLTESLPLVHQPQAATAGYTGTGYSVAVLDTGIDYLGTNFGNGATTFGNCSGGVNTGTCKVAYMQDFGTDDSSLDDNGHGTNVAAIVLGVAPGAKVLGLDVFTGGGAFDSDILSAINWVIADRTGSNVYNIASINMSLGLANNYNTSQCGASAYATPFANLRAAGVLPVVASGNSAFAGGATFNLGIASPACAPGAISVGAVYDSAFGQYVGSCSGIPGGGDTSATDRVTCFSQTGSFLSVLAPGARIVAAGINDSGTSQAAPHVAGAIALLAQGAPASTVAQRETAITTTGPNVLDWRTAITKHRLDVCLALNSLGAACFVASPPTLAKAFNPVSVVVGGTSNLSFTITNPVTNTGALTGVGFTDTLPTGVVVATPNGLAGSCGGGTITAVAGSGVVSLTGATLAASANCTFSVNVIGTTVGVKNNLTGAVTSVEGGPGNTAAATLTVVSALQGTIDLKAAVLGSGAGGMLPTKLASYLSSAIAYLNLGTPTMKAAACQQMKLFKSAVTVAMRTDPVVLVEGPGWIAQADAIRAAIPCLPPN